MAWRSETNRGFVVAPPPSMTQFMHEAGRLAELSAGEMVGMTVENPRASHGMRMKMRPWTGVLQGFASEPGA